jgi:hypothetical protein
MNNTTQECFRILQKEYLNKYFKSMGFKHKNSYYIKELTEYSIIFNLQKSSNNTVNRTEFTFNVGIDIYDYFSLCNESPDNYKMGTFWIFRGRIGLFLFDKKDKWYVIGENIKFFKTGEKSLMVVRDNNPIINPEKIFKEIENDVNYLLTKYSFYSDIETLLLSTENIFGNININKYLLLYSIDRKLDKDKIIFYFKRYKEQECYDMHIDEKNRIIEYAENILKNIK